MSREEVKKHNQREWEHKKNDGEVCPQSCAWRGTPHKHIYEAKLIDWDGRRIPDPEYPYELVGLAVPVV